MNKRFFIFVILTSVALFFVNQYLTSKKQEEYNEYQQKQRLIEEANRKDNASNVNERTASLKSLPLHRAFSDVDGKQPLTWAVNCGNQTFMTTSWGEKWADVIYVDGKAARVRDVQMRYLFAQELR